MFKSKKKNLSKDEIKSQMAANIKIAHIKDVVNTVFPMIAVDTIYDGQTTVNALSGLITAEIEKKMEVLKLSDLTIDLSSEPESKIKTAIVSIIEAMKDEPAQALAETLERLGTTFQAYGADIFLKTPMADLKVTDILAK